MELEWQGRNVVLERSSELSPLGSLRAVDGDTGSPLPELGAADCGQVLTGVEESVFRRSAFLSQRGAAVSTDPQLEKRLSSLVTAGSEDYAYAEIDGKLKKLQNRLQYNQSGELPQLRAEVETIDRRLADGTELRQEQNRLLAELQVRQDEASELERIHSALEQQERANLRRAAEDCREQLHDAEARRAALSAACGQLPPAETLDRLQARVRELQTARQTAEMEDRMAPIEMPEAPADNPFSADLDLTPDQLHEKDAAFAASVQQVREAEHLPGAAGLRLWLALGGLFGMLLLIVSYYFRTELGSLRWVLAGLGAVLITGSIIRFICAFRRLRRARNRAAELLRSFDCQNADQLEARAAELRCEIDAVRAARAGMASAAAERLARDRALSARQNDLLGELSQMGAVCQTLEQAELWLGDSVRTRQSLEAAARSERQLRDQFDRLRHHAEEPEAPAEAAMDVSAYDPVIIRDRLSRARAALVPLRSEADRLAGRIGALGDALELDALRREKCAEVARLERRYTAIQLSRRVLKEADEALRARFAPMLCKRAGELLCRLTGGAYDRLQLDREMHVTVHPAGSPVDRPLSYLSGGTVDQLYLALRLAICDLLLPNAPIILDDALVYFDDERLKAALDLLRELGKNRQILLFTCQDREKRILDQKA